MKLEDKTMSVLSSAMGKIQSLEFEGRKHHDFDYADGLHDAWKVLCDANNDYVARKAAKNPLWRFRVWLKYKQSSNAIRDIEI